MGLQRLQSGSSGWQKQKDRVRLRHTLHRLMARSGKPGSVTNFPPMNLVFFGIAMYTCLSDVVVGDGLRLRVSASGCRQCCCLCCHRCSSRYLHQLDAIEVDDDGLELSLRRGVKAGEVRDLGVGIFLPWGGSCISSTRPRTEEYSMRAKVGEGPCLVAGEGASWNRDQRAHPHEG